MAVALEVGGQAQCAWGAESTVRDCVCKSSATLGRASSLKPTSWWRQERICEDTLSLEGTGTIFIRGGSQSGPVGSVVKSPAENQGGCGFVFGPRNFHQVPGVTAELQQGFITGTCLKGPNTYKVSEQPHWTFPGKAGHEGCVAPCSLLRPQPASGAQTCTEEPTPSQTKQGKQNTAASGQQAGGELHSAAEGRLGVTQTGLEREDVALERAALQDAGPRGQD